MLINNLNNHTVRRSALVCIDRCERSGCSLPVGDCRVADKAVVDISHIRRRMRREARGRRRGRMLLAIVAAVIVIGAAATVWEWYFGKPFPPHEGRYLPSEAEVMESEFWLDVFEQRERK